MRAILLYSVAFLLLPGALGLDFSMGSSSGAAVSTTLDASPETVISGSVQMGAGVAVNSMTVSGSGAYSFDQNFTSVGGSEKVRLVANLEDSAAYQHGYQIESREADRIKVSQSLGVVDGVKVEAWNEARSGSLVARSGVKVLAGSLNYTGYGDASTAKVTAGQVVTIPANTRTSVFAEARNEMGGRSSSLNVMSSKPKTATTTATATPTGRSILHSIGS